jgi:hypothetical protein
MIFLALSDISTASQLRRSSSGEHRVKVHFGEIVAATVELAESCGKTRKVERPLEIASGN